MTGHQQVQQPQSRMTKSTKQKNKSKQEPAKQQEPETILPTINVDELAREKVKEVEKSLKELTSFKLDAFNSWFSILKQIISAADLHRTNDGQEKENAVQTNKQETGDSIYADYGDDNEQFTAHVDLSEQLATNSVKWTIRVQAFKIVHRLVRLLSNSQINIGSSNGTKLSPILERYLPDLVRLSFVAATSPYDELKMQGLEMFKFLIEKFAAVEEKEFPGHSILEQYKTQVLSAVKPAFNLDAPPYITAIASQICSLWICQGLEKEFSDVKRTYQLMLLSIEKLEGQSENQHSKLYTESELEQERVDILGSWAQLYVTSLEPDLLPSHYGRLSTLTQIECTNLNQLVKPQLESLVDKWWEALKDYALLIMPAPKFIGISHDNEHVYTREVALRLFSPTWPKLVLALSAHLSKENINNNLIISQHSEPINELASTSNSDSESPRRQRASKAKYSKFLSGILMKELSRCLVASHEIIHQASQKNYIPPQMSSSTTLSLRSLHLLLSNAETSSVFIENLTIGREFYTTLYGITVAYGREEPNNRVLLYETLDLLYHMTLERVVGDKTVVRYALAKLASSLLASMKNIDIACRQKSLHEVDLHKRHLAIRLRNILTLVKTAPQLALSEAPLQEALIAVFQEMLRFEHEPSVSLSLASQLEALYPAIVCERHRNHIIEEVFPDLCKRAQDILMALVASSTSSNFDKLKLTQIEPFLLASKAAINESSANHRAGLIDEFIKSILSSLKGVIDQKVDDLVTNENRHKRELVDYCLDHVTIMQKTFPNDSQVGSIDKEAKSLYESTKRLQQEVKDQIDLKNKKQQEFKKSTNVKANQSIRPSAAKITLKADFSNFYAKKV